MTMWLLSPRSFAIFVIPPAASIAQAIGVFELISMDAIVDSFSINASKSIRTMEEMSIHAKIRTGRNKLGMTEQQFADRLDVSRATIQQWEREGGTAPARKRQEAVAKLIGMTVAELMSDDAPKAHKAPTEWPFEGIDYERWSRLTERQKGRIEKAIIDELNAIEPQPIKQTKSA